ncbi:MAG: hypothetical protein ACI9WS_001140, partial [Paraglaciecola psychrophila]
MRPILRGQDETATAYILPAADLPIEGGKANNTEKCCRCYYNLQVLFQRRNTDPARGKDIDLSRTSPSPVKHRSGAILAFIGRW